MFKNFMSKSVYFFYSESLDEENDFLLKYTKFLFTLLTIMWSFAAYLFNNTQILSSISEEKNTVLLSVNVVLFFFAFLLIGVSFITIISNTIIGHLRVVKFCIAILYLFITSFQIATILDLHVNSNIQFYHDHKICISFLLLVIFFVSIVTVRYLFKHSVKRSFLTYLLFLKEKLLDVIFADNKENKSDVIKKNLAKTVCVLNGIVICLITIQIIFNFSII